MSPASPTPSRIAYVDHAFEVGGAEKSLLDIIERLDRSRFEPVLLCAQGAKWLQDRPLTNVAIDPVFAPGGVLETRRDEIAAGVTGNLRKLRAAGAPVLALYRRLRRHRLALVHTNTLKAHMLAGAAAHLAGQRLIWHLRDILDEGTARDWLVRAARRLKPKVIAISEAVRRTLDGTDLDVVVIHNGTDLSSFRPVPDRQKLREVLGLRHDEVVIAIVGRLTPWKGHRELLRAMAEVARDEQRTKLIVVGEVAFWEDEYDAELKRLAQDLGIAPLVQWLGFRDDVPEVLGACDIFALPSVDEPFGRVVVEAMACELPAVATRSGGVPEIVVEGETGLLVPPGDHGALASALMRLIRDPALRQSMGRAGRVRATELFDVNRTAERVQKLYGELLGLA